MEKFKKYHLYYTLYIRHKFFKKKNICQSCEIVFFLEIENSVNLLHFYFAFLSYFT